MMPLEAQRRSAVRRPAALLLGSSEDPRLFGRTRDLSIAGAFVETDVRPTVGSTFEIALVWREHLYACRARVARHAADGLGLAFLDPSPTFVQAMRTIVAPL